MVERLRFDRTTPRKHLPETALLLVGGMWYSPESLVVVAAFVLLAPEETLHPRDAGVAARIAACESPSPSLPDSIQLPDGLESIVRQSLEHSPRFRQQCRELARSKRLRAKVRLNYYPAPGSTARALTTFRQTELGSLVAQIEIRRVLDLTELLAHELEHVLEQVEGVDLDALSEDGEARRLPGGAFETARAVQAGHRVAAEVVDNTPDRVRSASASVWRTIRRAVR